MTVQSVRIVEVSLADSPVLTLMDAQQSELRALYADTTEVTEACDPASLSGVGGVLVAAERDGSLVGCGALKRWDAGTAEVRRMYVTPDARGSGAARAPLDALIARGGALGYARLVLETGDRQHAAVALYAGRVPACPELRGVRGRGEQPVFRVAAGVKGL
ncbi:GNAT family N-acetyltransferase [Deinococcus daejeonensis]|uniref:N-acetyltransferase domain-containing protein n=1 Tax=Deinococcus daejeonensis TaxID=1007098 RepID=A0ABQ2JJ62_9DEIO|nr:GNAT family N-acetyltransferase [Deinococcus daejeonensis]GGN46328.1 hypothetical protein GCM10010842_36800 [Deinococcus daejeonensis]